jgi:uncharacterized membrane protein
METRPQIKLTSSKLDNLLELFGRLFVASMWLLTIYVFFKLPKVIPIHFGASGQPDRYGDKLILLSLPIIATILYFSLTWLIKYPHIFNYSTKITEANAEKQYSIATRMLRFIKISILIIFSLIILFVYLTTIGATNGLGIWYLPLTLCLILIPTIVSISESFKKKNN